MLKPGVLCVIVLGVVAACAQSAKAADACAELRSQLSALEVADREQWEGQGAPADPYAIERQRTAILKALAANRCRSADVRRKGRQNGLFASLLGNKRPFRSGVFRNGGPFGDRFPGDDLTAGTYRTVCVRTCDGYYFPISFSASGGELQRDANACRALCPGQQVAIYLQASPGEDGGPVISLSGEPYTALSAAFRYRSEYDPDCTCGAIDAKIATALHAFAVPLPNQGMPYPMDAAGEASSVPLPPAKSRGDDPDTVANRFAAFVPGPITRQPMGVAAFREGPDGKVVRLVGPAATFLGE